MSQTTHNETDVLQVDASDCLCPMPLLKLKMALKSLAAEAVVELLASDPTSQQDIPAYCRISGNPLLGFSQRDGLYIYRVQKKA
ncbi:sulfurtransferase TusA family protein [Halioxenophilus sp. WMMB6]|uniref:sulfurtransferase TusA family protein n=1 Tax=Halioxenophilus sp. WMMB6 TaxID=3073815 RepID=UPI00295F401E|nr:sulfurtransferase TusA family protein [Halioxenophilus sp. WMMB6]